MSSFLWWQGCFIAGVSFYDAWLVVVGKAEILSAEQNPICWYLISLDPDHLRVFLMAKTVGTLTVLAILFWLHLRSHWQAVTTSSGVATFQFGLLLYLHT